MPSMKTPWKPPLGLLLLDVLGVVLLAIGLVMHFAPDAALAQALPGTLRLPLLIIGGAMAALGWAGMVASLLAHRRR
jgi:hypothetical protein